MNMAFVNAIRKLGWPDTNGNYQYGNAAVLCYLTHHNTKTMQFVERHKNMRIKDLIVKSA